MAVRRAIFSSILVAAVLFAATEAGLSDSDINKIVGVANYFRSRSGEIRGQNSSGAVDMLALEWSETLAASARNEAAKCPEEHTVGIEWGENIAFATPSGTFNYFELFRFWFEKEGASYDLVQNKCLKNQECGHWRQLMWSSVRKIGCALNRCENLLVLNTYPGDILICHFDRATIHNQRPFKSGPPCSACPPGNTCSQNLCLAPGQTLIIENAQASSTSSTPTSTLK